MIVTWCKGQILFKHIYVKKVTANLEYVFVILQKKAD